MAYLNVRERRIETKIAYVGPQLGGKATNLQQLQNDVARGRTTQLAEEDGGALASMQWVPLQKSQKFRDCDVAVKIVAAHGALSAERLGAVLADVDGVVVVIDAAPTAQEENRRAVSLVREALSKDAAARQVVVQLNKSDLEDAIDAGSVAATLETQEWPVVKASAARGEGVVETLEMALANVIEAMNTADLTTADVKVDHNPLLSALRQVLRDTVTEHMATLEREMMARVHEALGAGSAPRVDDALVSRLERLESVMEQQRESLGAIRTDQLSGATEAAQANVTLEHACAELGRQLEQTSSDVTLLLAVTRESGARLKDVSTRVVELEGQLGALATRDDLSELEQRALADAAARGRSDREYVSAAVAVVRRGVEGLGADVKKQDVSAQLASVASGLRSLEAKSDALNALAPAAADLSARLKGLEATIQRDVGARIARLEDNVQSVRNGLGESTARSDATLNEMQGGLKELVEELKKPKKGWFG